MPDFSLPDDTVFYTATAIVSEFSDQEKALSLARAVLPDVETANEVLDASGNPRMLKVTAWIAHAGYPNRNRQGFTAEDLEEAVTEGTLFAAPYFGMFDYNHDFIPRGVWYKASYGMDPKAGHTGILAEGVVFAWRFPELANQMIADQVRDGSVKVSMACLSEWREYREDVEGSEYALLRKPKFLATSYLDVKQADPQARGTVGEDPESSSEEREQQLMAASETKAIYEVNLKWLSKAADNKEDDMDLDVIIAAIKDALGEAAEAQTEALKDLAEKAAKLPDVEQQLAEAQTQLDTANAKVTELEGKLEDAELAKTTLESSLEQANTELETVKTEKDELVTFKAGIEAKEAEAAQAALREERLAALNEAATAALAAIKAEDEEKYEAFVARWIAMDEDEWKVTLASLNVVQKKGFLERSNDEGTLTPGGGQEQGPLAGFKSARWAK